MVQTQKRIHQRFLTDALRICWVITFRVLSEKVLPPHRVLCCETEVGLKSIVRQIEPELHVDAHHHVAVELGRFLPNVLYITSPHHPSASTTPTSSAAPTVPSTLLSATSFRAFFGP